MNDSVSVIDKSNFIKQFTLDNYYVKQFTLDNYYECYIRTNSLLVDCIYDLYNIIRSIRVNNIMKEIGHYKIGITNKHNLSIVYLYIGLFCETYWDKKHNSDTLIGWCYYKLSAEIGNCYGMSRLGNYYFDLKDYDKAIRWLVRSLINHCNKASVCCRIAQAYSNKKCYDFALKYYEMAIGSEPPYKSAIYGRIADIHRRELRNELAVKYYKMAIENETKNPSEFHHKIAIVYEKLNETTQAISHYRLAIKNGYVDTKQSYYNMAAIFEREDEWKTLISHCLVMIDNKYDDTGLVHAGLADSYRMCGDYEEAIKYCNISIEMKYPDAKIYGILGDCYRETRRFTDSMKYYKISLKKGCNIAIQGIAVTYFRMREYAKAIKYIGINIEFYSLGKINILDEDFEPMLKVCNQSDVLLRFYIGRNDYHNILRMLNTKNHGFQVCTLAGTINYFEKATNVNNMNNCLYQFVKNIVCNKIFWLDTHFKFSIKSDGYEKAKEDFKARTNMDNT